MTETPLRLNVLLERLVDADIRFVLVGGLAVGAWGYVRGTKDLDVVPDPAIDNLERLAAFRTGDRTLVATELGPIDVLQGMPQIPSFATLDAEATDVEINGLSVRIREG